MLVLKALLQFHQFIDINLLALSQFLILPLQYIHLPLLVFVRTWEKGKGIGLVRIPLCLDRVVCMGSVGHVSVTL